MYFEYHNKDDINKIATLTAERDEARKEIAELRSAPGMEEVDAACEVVYEGIVEYDVDSDCEDDLGKLCDIARRAIDSREEVEGLIKWWVSFKDGFGQLEGMATGSGVEEWKDNARRILEIVEGK